MSQLLSLAAKIAIMGLIKRTSTGRRFWRLRMPVENTAL